MGKRDEFSTSSRIYITNKIDTISLVYVSQYFWLFCGGFGGAFVFFSFLLSWFNQFGFIHNQFYLFRFVLTWSDCPQVSRQRYSWWEDFCHTRHSTAIWNRENKKFYTSNLSCPFFCMLINSSGLVTKLNQ